MSVRMLIEESKVNFSKTYGWNVLQDNGFRCKTQSVKWSLLPTQKEARLKWAKELIKKPEEFWHRVIFTDETKVQFKSTKERYWVNGEER